VIGSARIGIGIPTIERSLNYKLKGAIAVYQAATSRPK